jgi:L-amino acid N-acyltransferase YncA
MVEHMTPLRYTEADIPQMLSIVGQHLGQTSYKHFSFSEDKMQDMLISGLNRKSFHCSVVKDGEKIIGGLCATVTTPVFSYDAITADHFFYVEPGRRNIRVATGLVADYIEWAKSRKVRMIQLSNSMGTEVERFAKLAERLGFSTVGSIHFMEI